MPSDKSGAGGSAPGERPASPRGIGYVLKVFPRVSETFVINEIRILEQMRGGLTVFSLHRPEAEVRHGILRDLTSPLHYVEGATEPTPRESRKATGRLMEHFDIAEADRALLLPRRYVRLAMALAGMVKESRIRHLHAHFASRSAHVAALAAALARCSYSVTAHAKDIYHCEVDPAVLRWKLAHASFVVTVTDYNKRHLDELLGDSAGARCVVRVYNGIDLSRFVAAPYAAARPGRIVAVGRLVPKKGFDVLIEACHLLRRRGVAFTCEIFGSGAGETSLREQVERSGLRSLVSLPGSLTTEEVGERLREAAVVALPCVVDTQGNVDALPTVLLEAMGTARPVVSTRLSGIPEIVADGETGLLVPPRDAAQLADALQALLSDPARAGEMGRAGRQRAERLFDLRTNAAAVGRLMRRAMDARVS